MSTNPFTARRFSYGEIAQKIFTIQPMPRPASGIFNYEFVNLKCEECGCRYIQGEHPDNECLTGVVDNVVGT